MVRRQCVCGGPLHGLQHRGENMFGFIPSSSLAHYNYDCEFETGVTLPGGRMLEQCQQCGSLILLEYPTLDGSLRGDDPLITYGPGTVYEQCDLASVPVTYRSFRALMSSGVTGGVMYSTAFRYDIARLFKTDPYQLPSWKVVKDALLDPANSAIDEWWFASIGRNFIVLYENSSVLQLVSAWHRIPGTEIKNSHITHINSLNTDPLRHAASDTLEMSVAHHELDLPDEQRQLLAIGNDARLKLIDHGIRLGRPIRELAQWASVEQLAQGRAILDAQAVEQLVTTSFGIRHAVLHDGDDHCEVDVLMRRGTIAKITCSCELGQKQRVCAHMVATVMELARRYHFHIDIPQQKTMAQPTSSQAVDVTAYSHYADVANVLKEHRGVGPQYEMLTQYAQPFSSNMQPLYHIEFMSAGFIGIPNVGYCVYDNIVLSFIDAVLHDGMSDYAQVLARYGLDKDVDLSILNIDLLDRTLTAALITMIVYKERHHEGYLAEMLENGILAKLLTHLEELDQA